MTYFEICERLRLGGVESPEWDARLMIEHFCGQMPLAALSDPHAPLPECDGLKEAVERRCRREPLQYILGVWEFYRQTYEVSPACLVPRSDTEILVEEAIRRLPAGAYFADLCTGSGCIAVSVLSERADTAALAVELSEDALALAQRNAERNGVASRFLGVRGDVLEHDPPFADPKKRPIAILSNPPYIRTEVLPSLEPEVQREPKMALDGGSDGLIFYRALLELAKKWLDPKGFCLFEIGYDQGAEIALLAEEKGFSCVVKKDLGGCDRVAILTPRLIE